MHHTQSKPAKGGHTQLTRQPITSRVMTPKMPQKDAEEEQATCAKTELKS